MVAVGGVWVGVVSNWGFEGNLDLVFVIETNKMKLNESVEVEL